MMKVFLLGGIGRWTYVGLAYSGTKIGYELDARAVRVYCRGLCPVAEWWILATSGGISIIFFEFPWVARTNIEHV